MAAAGTANKAGGANANGRANVTISERMVNALLDYHDLRLRTMQTTIDALAAENDRLHKHNAKLALDLAMTQSDFKGVIK